MKQKRKKSSTRGTIFVIISMLIASAALRIPLGPNEVRASSDNDAPPTSTKTDAQNSGDISTSELLRAMQQREEKISLMEQNLKQREKVLEIAKEEVERRIETLEISEQRLRATLTNANSAAKDDVNQLIKVYENMKPKDAAALFEAMEPSFAAGFLGQMRAETAAGVMAGLSPKTAYTLSVILAGRNAKAPKE